MSEIDRSSDERAWAATRRLLGFQLGRSPPSWARHSPRAENDRCSLCSSWGDRRRPLRAVEHGRERLDRAGGRQSPVVGRVEQREVASRRALVDDPFEQPLRREQVRLGRGEQRRRCDPQARVVLRDDFNHARYLGEHSVTVVLRALGDQLGKCGGLGETVDCSDPHLDVAALFDEGVSDLAGVLPSVLDSVGCCAKNCNSSSMPPSVKPFWKNGLPATASVLMTYRC